MKFEIGDHVSFIDAKQDGIIVSIKNTICVVELTDGFTIDAQEKELVKIQGGIQDKFKSQTPTPATAKTQSDEKISIDFIKELVLANQVGILAIPKQSKVLSGAISYSIYNGSSYDVLYTLHKQIGKRKMGLAAGLIAKNQVKELFEEERTTLIDVDHLVIDILFYKDGEYAFLNGITKQIAIEIPGLTQNYSKVPAPFCFAINHLVFGGHTEEVNDMSEFMDKFKSLPQTFNVKQVKKDSKVSPVNTTLRDFGLSGSDMEVDLHIEELVDDLSKLKPSELIDIQLHEFRKKLDKALVNNRASIVFIHGVGNGKLKSAIRAELKSHNLRYKDGDFLRYGYGATEVLLR